MLSVIAISDKASVFCLRQAGKTHNDTASAVPRVPGQSVVYSSPIFSVSDRMAEERPTRGGPTTDTVTTHSQLPRSHLVVSAAGSARAGAVHVAGLRLN